jgi:RNA polymerase sigma-70 factor (ECF subfamily)
MMGGAMAGGVEQGEAELLAQLRAGRSSAYAALMRRNNQRLYRLARGILRDDAEAEEAVQEGYIRAFTRLDGFKGEASLATWLARIVLNEALGRLRRRHPTVELDDAAGLGDNGAGLVQAEPSPEQAMARLEIRRAIEKAVDALPAPFRSVFMLRAIEQLSIEETAACLGIPGETVKTRLHRAHKLLRLSLADQFAMILDGAFPFRGVRCDRLVARVIDRLGLAAETSLASPPGDRPAPPVDPP